MNKLTNKNHSFIRVTLMVAVLVISFVSFNVFSSSFVSKTDQAYQSNDTEVPKKSASFSFKQLFHYFTHPVFIYSMKQ